MVKSPHMHESWINQCAQGVDRMRHRQISWIAVIALCLVVIVTGCGSKNAETIVKDLDKVVSKMESYQGSGTMTLHTGQQPLTYKVEVMYQKPQHYRISLTNEKRDITQIVLRNDEGVFVLTPQLGKSYRFQSDWPENQGQVYLYQTLIKSILVDNSRQFTTDKDDYVFDVMASNYQNGSFARQKITLDHESYAPKHVEVSDTNANVMVEITFDSFDFDKKFDSSVFDMKLNLEGGKAKPSGSNENTPSPSATPTASPSTSPSASPSAGTSAGTDQQGEAVEPEQSEEEPTTAVPLNVNVTEPDPDVLPAGVVLLDQTDVELGENIGVMLRYTGPYDFTIIETIAKDQAVTLMEGIVLDLGFTAGHLTDGEYRTLTWTYEGTEYRLSSADLPDDDMIRIAQSMVTSSAK